MLAEFRALFSDSPLSQSARSVTAVYSNCCSMAELQNKIVLAVATNRRDSLYYLSLSSTDSFSKHLQLAEDVIRSVTCTSDGKHAGRHAKVK